MEAFLRSLKKRPLEAFTGFWFAAAVFFLDKVGDKNEKWQPTYEHGLSASAALFAIFLVMLLATIAVKKWNDAGIIEDEGSTPKPPPTKAITACSSISAVVLSFFLLPIILGNGGSRTGPDTKNTEAPAEGPAANISGGAATGSTPREETPAADNGLPAVFSRSVGRVTDALPVFGTKAKPAAEDEGSSNPGPISDSDEPKPEPPVFTPPPPESAGSEWVRVGRKTDDGDGFDQAAGAGASSFSSWNDLKGAAGRRFDVSRLAAKRCDRGDPSSAKCTNAEFTGQRKVNGHVVDDSQTIWIRVN